MKYPCSLLFLLLVASPLTAQTIKPDLGAQDVWEVINREAKITEDPKRGKVIHLNDAPDDGIMLHKDVTFSSGTITFELKGKNLPGQSFVGIVFHYKDRNTFDAIYFRPFNFLNEEAIRRTRSVQYISMPDYTWNKLRETFPGKYENKVDPVPAPDEWFAVKIIVDERAIKVFVNNASNPSLEVEKISKTNYGRIGFWVGNGSSGSFANLVISPAKK